MVFCVVCMIVVLINSVGYCDGLPLRCVLLFSLAFWMICVMLFCGVVCMWVAGFGCFWFVIIAWGWFVTSIF